jgi:hypothetical protein
VHVDDLAVLIDGPVQIVQRSPTFTYVSSTNHPSPDTRRQGRAASMNPPVNVCTQRQIVT